MTELTTQQVVERDSGVLGYPSEISAPMDADHHNVSKFSNPEDPNYVALRGVIRDIVRKSASSGRCLLHIGCTRLSTGLTSIYYS